MAKAAGIGVKPVEICEVDDADDHRLRIVLRLGPKLSGRVREMGKRRDAAVSAAINKALRA